MQGTQVHMTVGDAQAKSAQRLRIADGSNVTTALMAAAIRAIFGGKPAAPARKPRKPIPTMVCSPAAEIAAHNAAVNARKAKTVIRDTRKARIKALGGIRQFKRWEYAHRDELAA